MWNQILMKKMIRFYLPEVNIIIAINTENSVPSTRYTLRLQHKDSGWIERNTGSDLARSPDEVRPYRNA
jgi:hypothetical protein